MLSYEFIGDYVRDLVIPNDYFIEASDGMIILSNARTSFRLTDRTFGDTDLSKPAFVVSDIDYFTNYALSRTIERIIQQDGHAKILDVACGPMHRAAYQIAQRYGESVEVHALDICSLKHAPQAANLKVAIQSALDLPYEDRFFDVVYSFQFLTYLPTDERKRAFHEILRVMKSDAILDILDPLYLQSNDWLQDDLDPSSLFFFPLDLSFLLQYGDSSYRAQPIRDFKSVGPGYITLNDSQLTPYLHITKSNSIF